MISISSSQELVMFAGVLLSLLIKYVPNFNFWYAELRVTVRQTFMLSLLVGVVALFFVGGCLGITGVECNVASVKELALLLIMAIVGNQATHAITPELARVKEVKTFYKRGDPLWSDTGGNFPLTGGEEVALIASGIVIGLSAVAVALLSIFAG